MPFKVKEIPTPLELREYLRSHGISGMKAAEIVGMNRAKFRLFMIDSCHSNHKPIPWAVWYTLTDRVAKGEHL